MNIYFLNSSLEIDSIITFRGLSIDSIIEITTIRDPSNFEFLFTKGIVIQQDRINVDTNNIMEWNFGKFLPTNNYFRLKSQPLENDEKLCYLSNGRLFGISCSYKDKYPFFQIHDIRKRKISYFTYEEMRSGCVIDLEKASSLTSIKTSKIGLIKKFNNTHYIYSKRNSKKTPNYKLLKQLEYIQLL
ncbi:MAG: hypothetical protein K1X55_14830 [Chitinophagales bacterium]|nr:hypothetical protein [Chitinophagales bacterium]